jgi:hypothetical protein
VSLSSTFSTIVTHFLRITGYGGGGQQQGPPAPPTSVASGDDSDDDTYFTPDDEEYFTPDDDVDSDSEDEEGFVTAPLIPDGVDTDSDDEYVSAPEGSDDHDEQSAIDEARRHSAEFDQRFAVVKRTEPAGAEFVAAYLAYVRAKRKLTHLLEAGDGSTALEACQTVEARLTAFERVARPKLWQRQRKAERARSQVAEMSDDDLKSRSLKKKAYLAMDLCADGPPTDPGTRRQLCRVYRQSPPDPQFLEQRKRHRDAIIARVSTMPEIAALYDDRGDLNKGRWDRIIQKPERAQALLTQVCDVQTEVLGMPKVPVRARPPTPKGPRGGIKYGSYDPRSNSINLNLHRDALEQPIQALNTILHETFHAHQEVLIRRLRSGRIGPRDPDYPTALMLLANDIAYLQRREVGGDNYKRQPMEIDAEENGMSAAQAVLQKVKQSKPRADKRPKPRGN